MQIYTDPATGRRFTVDPVTAAPRWLDELPQAPVSPPRAPISPARPVTPVHPLTGPRGIAVAPPPKRRGGAGAMILGVIIGVVLVIGIVGTALNRAPAKLAAPPDTTPNAAPSPSAAAPKGAGSAHGAAKVGTPVRDDTLEFTVMGTKVAKKISNGAGSATARGQFLLVSLTLRNVSNDSQTFSAVAQRLYDTRGKAYLADSNAAIFLDDAGTSLSQQIPPGSTAPVTVVFDLPVGATPDRIELHDAPFSDGADAKVR